MAEPPSLAGGVQVTVAVLFPRVAVATLGAPGTVGALGVTEADANDGRPVPMALIALTWKVNATPGASPGITTLVTFAGTVTTGIGVGPPVVTIWKPVIGEPPVMVGGVKDT